MLAYIEGWKDASKEVALGKTYVARDDGARGRGRCRGRIEYRQQARNVGGQVISPYRIRLASWLSKLARRHCGLEDGEHGELGGVDGLWIDDEERLELSFRCERADGERGGRKDKKLHGRWFPKLVAVTG